MNKILIIFILITVTNATSKQTLESSIIPLNNKIITSLIKQNETLSVIIKLKTKNNLTVKTNSNKFKVHTQL